MRVSNTNENRKTKENKKKKEMKKMHVVSVHVV